MWVHCTKSFKKRNNFHVIITSFRKNFFIYFCNGQLPVPMQTASLFLLKSCMLTDRKRVCYLSKLSAQLSYLCLKNNAAFLVWISYELCTHTYKTTAKKVLLCNCWLHSCLFQNNSLIARLLLMHLWQIQYKTLLYNNFLLV